MPKVLIENLLGSKARIRILKTLVKERELNISSLIKRARLNYTDAIKHLNLLKKRKLIQEKRFGRIRIFKCRKDSVRLKALKHFIYIWEDQF